MPHRKHARSQLRKCTAPGDRDLLSHPSHVSTATVFTLCIHKSRKFYDHNRERKQKIKLKKKKQQTRDDRRKTWTEWTFHSDRTFQYLRLQVLQPYIISQAQKFHHEVSDRCSFYFPCCGLVPFESRKGKPYAFIPYISYMDRVLFTSRKNRC